jgi:hypothetical protein
VRFWLRRNSTAAISELERGGNIAVGERLGGEKFKRLVMRFVKNRAITRHLQEPASNQFERSDHQKPGGCGLSGSPTPS